MFVFDDEWRPWSSNLNIWGECLFFNLIFGFVYFNVDSKKITSQQPCVMDLCACVGQNVHHGRTDRRGTNCMLIMAVLVRDSFFFLCFVFFFSLFLSDGFLVAFDKNWAVMYVICFSVLFCFFCPTMRAAGLLKQNKGGGSFPQ